MRFLSFLLVIFHLWLALVQAAHAGSANVAVTVTGTGPTLELARSDATRQALQQTISQLVVVDREISGNTVLRDRVLSTMNGYIDKFVVRREIKTGAEFSVTADVVVSASRIENFIGIVTSAGGAFDGSSLLAEQARRQAQAQADILQRKARGEIFDNVLRPFPSKAMSIRILGITLSNTSPDELVITVEVTHNPEFIKALEGSVEALSVVKCVPGPRRNMGYGAPPPPEYTAQFMEFSDLLPGIARDLSKENLCRYGQPVGYDWGKEQPVVCFGRTTTVQCYGLAPGDYCASCRLKSFVGPRHSLQIIGRFVDRTGQSADSGLCLARLAEPKNLIADSLIRPGWPNTTFLATFDFESKQAEIRVSTKGVSLDRARYFVAVAALQDYADFNSKNQVVTSVLEDHDSDYAACALLDEAVHIRQLEGFDDSVNILR